MKTFKAVVLAIVVVFTLTACAGTQVKITDTVIQTVAPKVGYAAYRLIPDAKTPLSIICSMCTMQTEEQIVEFKQQLGKIWQGATKISNLEAQLIWMGINDIVALTGINTSNPDYERVKTIIDGICSGVEMAQRG